MKAGDTAGVIANSNGMTLAEFVRLNALADPDKLRVGQTVKIAAKRPSAGSGAAPRTVAPVENVVHPIPAVPAEKSVPSVPVPTTRPPMHREPALVTPEEATAAPGSTVTAGDTTIHVETALSGGGLGAARQRVQEAPDQAREAAQAAGAQTAGAVRAAVAPGTREYVVQEGDDIYSIAMQFDSQPLRIRSLNGGKSLDDLAPGDRILVPAK